MRHGQTHLSQDQQMWKCWDPFPQTAFTAKVPMANAARRATTPVTEQSRSPHKPAITSDTTIADVTPATQTRVHAAMVRWQAIRHLAVPHNADVCWRPRQPATWRHTVWFCPRAQSLLCTRQGGRQIKRCMDAQQGSPRGNPVYTARALETRPSWH